MTVYPTRLPFHGRVCHCLFKKQKFGKWRYIKGREWGGSTKSHSVCFTKNWVKIGAFNATPTSKIWKTLSVDQKDQRRRSVWVGQAVINMSTVYWCTVCLHVKAHENQEKTLMRSTWIVVLVLARSNWWKKTDVSVQIYNFLEVTAVPYDEKSDKDEQRCDIRDIVTRRNVLRLEA